MEHLVPQSDVAKALGVTVQTLTNWRAAGKGPSFVKIGKLVKYRPGDVERFVEQQRQQPAQTAAS